MNKGKIKIGEGISFFQNWYRVYKYFCVMIFQEKEDLEAQNWYFSQIHKFRNRLGIVLIKMGEVGTNCFRIDCEEIFMQMVALIFILGGTVCNSSSSSANSLQCFWKLQHQLLSHKMSHRHCWRLVELEICFSSKPFLFAH